MTTHGSCGCDGAKCRIAADDDRHGTRNGYVNRGCRCAQCREAAGVGLPPATAGVPCGCEAAKCHLAAGDDRHGTANGYRNHGCRCAPCKATKREQAANYHQINKAAVSERRARHYAQNRQAVLSRVSRYREENAEEVNARYRAWCASPEGRAVKRAGERRRREQARLRHCGCATPINLSAVWALDQGRCAYCNAPGSDIDHVVPLLPAGRLTDSAGGWGCVSNYRVACRRCNRDLKKNKPLTYLLARLEASSIPIRPGATNSGLPCPEAAARMANRMLPVS